MKLYHDPLSRHSRRARLFLSLRGAPHKLVEVDLKAGARETPDSRALNPVGQTSVGSNAILAYLAKTFDRTRRIEALPGFVPFVETPVALSAAV